METSGELQERLRVLEQRVAELEFQLGFVDILLVPQVRAAAVASLSHFELRAEQLPPTASGFFPLERSPAGLAFRWTEFERGGRMPALVLGGMRYDGMLTIAPSAHVRGPADVRLTIGGRPVALGTSDSAAPLQLPFSFDAASSGVVEVMVNATSLLVPAEASPGAADRRHLGVSFCSLELQLLGDGAQLPPARAPDRAA